MVFFQKKLYLHRFEETLAQFLCTLPLNAKNVFYSEKIHPTNSLGY